MDKVVVSSTSLLSSSINILIISMIVVDLLCLDIDTVMTRNPTSSIVSFSESMSFDITVSRDHGPGNLEYSKKWGSSRLLTGFHSSSSGTCCLPRLKVQKAGVPNLYSSTLE